MTDIFTAVDRDARRGGRTIRMTDPDARHQAWLEFLTGLLDDTLQHAERAETFAENKREHAAHLRALIDRERINPTAVGTVPPVDGTADAPGPLLSGPRVSVPPDAGAPEPPRPTPPDPTMNGPIP